MVTTLNWQVPFLESDVWYIDGAEFGRLYAQMESEDNNQIEGHFGKSNEKQILLAAKTLGWQVTLIEYHEGGWFFCRMERIEREA